MARKKTKTKKNARAPESCVLSVRFPSAKLPELDAYVEGLQENQPGVNWTRSNACQRLILRGLEEGE